MLVWPRKGQDEKNKKKEKGSLALSVKDLFLFLKERFGRLEGVVITGGEPTLHPDLPSFIKEIKDMGYLVKLDTNGTNPLMLLGLIKEKLIDYIAMDIKAPFLKYETVVGAPVDCNNLKKSVKIIMNSKLPYEFRTTVVPGLLVKKDFISMGQAIKGASKWYLQFFKSDTDLVNTQYQKKEAYSSKEMESFVEIGKKYVDICELRQ